MVTIGGTNTEGKENKKGGPWVRPCMACGGKHKFQECLEWKQIQALMKDNKKKQGN